MCSILRNFAKIHKKNQPGVFIPTLGETATITWNLQNKHVVNVMVMHGEEIVAYLAKEKEYKGGYGSGTKNHLINIKNKICFHK